MKLTKQKLKEIIKEELSAVDLNEKTVLKQPSDVDSYERRGELVAKSHAAAVEAKLSTMTLETGDPELDRIIKAHAWAKQACEYGSGKSFTKTDLQVQDCMALKLKMLGIQYFGNAKTSEQERIEQRAERANLKSDQLADIAAEQTAEQERAAEAGEHPSVMALLRKVLKGF